MKEIEIKYPSVDKQDNIVKKLDKLSYIIQKRQKELDKLDELVKARFIKPSVSQIRVCLNYEKEKPLLSW